MIQFNCSNCGGILQADEKSAGQQYKCLKCNKYGFIPKSQPDIVKPNPVNEINPKPQEDDNAGYLYIFPVALIAIGFLIVINYVDPPYSGGYGDTVFQQIVQVSSSTTYAVHCAYGVILITAGFISFFLIKIIRRIDKYHRSKLPP